MKRILSLVLVLVLVLGSMPLAFADEDMTAGETLAELGLVKGDGEGNLLEDETLTRAQLAVMLTRLYGVEETAMDFSLPSTFTDVEEGSFYSPYIAYVEVQEWMNGVGGDMFDPDGLVTGQMVATTMLRVLGYEPEWTTAIEEAEAMGILDDNAGEAFTRANAFDMMLDTVNTNLKDSEMSLGQELELPGYDVEEPVEDVDVAVEGAMPHNLVQTKVMFNTAVDSASAETVANYTLTDADDADVAISDAELLEDGMTVVLTHAKLDQQDTATLDVEDVEDADENVIADFTSDAMEYLDTEIPTVVGSEVVGVDTIKVIFSEPMNGTDKANFEVKDADDDKLYIKSATLQNNETEALIELYSDLEDGEVSVKVLADTADYAGFGVIVTTETVIVVEDADAPTVVGYKDASPTSVTLIWSEDIEVADGTDTNFYHTNSNNEIDDNLVPGDIDGNEMTLDFTTNELPEGTAYVYVLADSVNDLWDIDNAQEMIQVEVELDETAPVVESSEVASQNSVEVTFSEDVVEGDDFAITLLDEDGEEVSNDTSVSITDEVMTITFDDDLYGEISVVIEDVEDSSENEAAVITLEFDVDDETAPVATDFSATLFDKGVATQLLVMDFGEEMDANDIVDKEMYFVGTDSFADLEDANSSLDIEFTVVDNGVEIEIDGTIVDLTGQDITIGRMADAAGNLMTTLTADITPTDAAGSSVAILSVEMTALDTIVMTFDDELVSFDDTKFHFQESGSNTDLEIANLSNGLDSDGNTTLTFTLDADLEANATTDGTLAVDYFTDASAGENVYGTEVEVVADGAAQISDKFGGAIALDGDDNELVTTVDSDANGKIDIIVVEYTEDIAEESLSLVTYDVDGYDITSVDVDDDGTGVATGTGSFVMLTVTELADPDTDATPEVTQLVDIKDDSAAAAAGNTIEASDAVNAMDTAGPVPMSATVSAGGFDAVDDTLTIVFSEPVALGDEIVASGSTLANVNDWLFVDYDGATGDEAFVENATATTYNVVVSSDTVVVTLKGDTLTEPLVAATSEVNVADLSNIVDLATTANDSVANGTAIVVD